MNGKWIVTGTCNQCGSPYFSPDLEKYRGLSTPPARKSCRCLNGPVKNLLEGLGVGTSIVNLIREWVKKPEK